ncbi:hypothetical protein CspeluHIS016_0109560 [Cutaneotrichosporon spelunceum]|uniref:CHCH domain-containing protein n=1 Tax=Cutaneotrichosporon spelunceum TaxID=1672016 RepID=A0AAD3TQ70_9TREE|nr:hypothetical protein CspeluHIS016_0109560 [Cutaneotrichosporon spelunceum]
MSFGRPGALSDNFKVSPPLRGSFPLDHDGECKTFMQSYMKCLKANKNDAGACRAESRDYLSCRMDNELMSREEFQNLGLGDVPATTESAKGATPRTEAGAGAGAATGTGAGTGAGATSTANTGGGGRYVPSERI